MDLRDLSDEELYDIGTGIARDLLASPSWGEGIRTHRDAIWRELLSMLHPGLGDPAQEAIQTALCRFENGKIVKREMPLDDTAYLAVSHVWGQAEWASIPGTR
jgi:hypothetical protein